MKTEIKKLPVINLKKCSGCNKCIVACEHNVLELIDMNAEKNNHSFFRHKRLKAILTNPSDCNGCGACISVCRHKAIVFKN